MDPRDSQPPSGSELGSRIHIQDSIIGNGTPGTTNSFLTNGTDGTTNSSITTSSGLILIPPQPIPLPLTPLAMNVFSGPLDTDVPLASLEDFYGPDLLYQRSYEQMADQAFDMVDASYTIEGTRNLAGYTAHYKAKLSLPDKLNPGQMISQEVCMDVQQNESPLTAKSRLFRRLLEIVFDMYPEKFYS